MKFASIASGSSGNCLFFGDEKSSFLIDAGISGKKIEEGLNSYDRKTEEIQGIFITHEHSDHIKGLGILSRKYGIPIYATSGTVDALLNMTSLGKIDRSLFHVIEQDTPFNINGFDVTAFSTYHDAADPVGYRIENSGKKLAVITDTGIYTEDIVNKLKGLDTVLIEANHDLRMLQSGHYPYYLKKRIMGDNGHMSNETAGRLLNSIIHDNMKKIFLGHLSRENNYELLAFETVCQEVTLSDNQYKAADFDISIAKRDEYGQLIEF